jgi:hypothetical protein
LNDESEYAALNTFDKSEAEKQFQKLSSGKNESIEPAKSIASNPSKGIGAYQLPSGKFAVLLKSQLQSADDKKMPIDDYVKKESIKTFDKAQDAKDELNKQIKNESVVESKKPVKKVVQKKAISKKAKK